MRRVSAYVDAAYSTGTIIPEREAGTRMLLGRADYGLACFPAAEVLLTCIPAQAC